jgi:polysaccharide biosynthesis/export protein
MVMKRYTFTTVFVLLVALLCQGCTNAKRRAASRQAALSNLGTASTGTPASAGKESEVQVPPGYIIGPEDVLTVVFWREKDLSGDVIVRPDGRISLPLLHEFQAAGLTPDQLRERVVAAADKYVQDPNVSVVIKQINSRRAFITGMVNKPGPYPLMSSTTVVQLIAMAGGLQDYAKKKNIVVMRTEGTQAVRYKFNYAEVIEGKNLTQNIELKPGDTVIVP